ncbi:(E,E)-geranyllinalool synthase [Glycine soja]
MWSHNHVIDCTQRLDNWIKAKSSPGNGVHHFLLLGWPLMYRHGIGCSESTKLSCRVIPFIEIQFASYYGWPVSTTHCIVGAMVGFGLAYGGVVLLRLRTIGPTCPPPPSCRNTIPVRRPFLDFYRDKTTYCYFAIAAATSLPHDSYIRIWDSKGLSGHSQVIFQVLNNLVSEASTKYLQQVGIYDDITNSMRDIWYETFCSWLIEAKWRRMGQTPSLDNYLKYGMISIAAHTLVLPASCFLKHSLPNDKLRPTNMKPSQNYLWLFVKEKDQGKINSVLVNMVEDLESSIEDSIALVTEMIHKKEKELLEHALIEGHNDLPKASNHLHLSCLKVFHMFFNCSNRYDSETAMLQDISKAIYLALSKNSKPFEVVPLQLEPKEKTPTPVSYSNSYFKHHKRTTFTAHQVSQPALRKGHTSSTIRTSGSVATISSHSPSDHNHDLH